MKTEIRNFDDGGIEAAKEILFGGGLVAFATETVYGLGAIGTLPDAVAEIFKVKGRPTNNPLIAHVHAHYDFGKLVYERMPYVAKLRAAFTPGPLTMVFDGKGIVCKEAVCGGDTLAIRVPSHAGAQRLLAAVNAPVVAPSANISGHVSPVTARHVFDDLNGKIPLILDGGKAVGGIESTVLDVTGEVPRILRAGLVTREMIISKVGRCEYALHAATDRVRSPGVLYAHYVPRCETARFAASETSAAAACYDEALQSGRRAAIICADDNAGEFANRRVLNLGATPEEMAANLFDTLRFGEGIADLLIALIPEGSGGVWDGLLNRFEKAFAKKRE